MGYLKKYLLPKYVEFDAKLIYVGGKVLSGGQ